MAFYSVDFYIMASDAVTEMTTINVLSNNEIKLKIFSILILFKVYVTCLPHTE